MRKKVNVPALVGVGIVLMLLLLVVVFRSMPAISIYLDDTNECIYESDSIREHATGT